MGNFEGLNTKYFWIVGILALIAFIPDAITLGFFAFLLPGFILCAAPTLFLYSVWIRIFFNDLKSLPGDWGWVAAVCAVVGIFTLVSVIFNYPTYKTINTLKEGDRFISAPVQLPDTIAILFSSRRDLTQSASACSELCQKLLYNGAVKRVMMDSLAPMDKATLGKTTRFYYISQQEPCLPASVLETSGFRPAGGCLLEGSAPLSEAEMILTEEEIKSSVSGEFKEKWNLASDNVRARQMTLYRNTADALEIIDRKTQVEADVLFIPLVIWPSGYGLHYTQGFLRKFISFNLYEDANLGRSNIFDEYRRLFGDAVK